MTRRILLVDDSPMMRRMVGSVLQEEGYEVILACDGREGVAKAREAAPDLIVTDYEMPEMDGPSMCRELKADHVLRSIPVIMLTTLGGTESKILGLDAGADDYIEKPKTPHDIKEIFARIRAQLRIADLRGELAERNQQLESAQAKFELELRLARKVQMGLMPSPPRPRGPMKMAVRYQPANQLGGDIYDFAQIDGNKLGILVADVSGHGVNSALLSGIVKALAYPLMSMGLAPDRVLAGLDEGIGAYFPEGFFCTAFYLILNEVTGEFDYAGIGHPAALLATTGGIRSLESDCGLLGVGMVDHLVVKSDKIGPGDALLVYTDGLPDAMDPADVLFGEKRIADVLQANRDLEPAAILDAIEAAVSSHVTPGHPNDDINMILAKILQT